MSSRPTWAGAGAQYTVLGDAVNVASRLQRHAEPSTVLVSRAVYERVAARVDAEALPPLRVQGRSEPLEVFRIRDVRDVSRPRVGLATPFHGRVTELRDVAAFLDRIPPGRAGVLVVEGEAGCGKSRLVAEAVTRGPTFLRFDLAFDGVRVPGQRSPAGALFHQLVAGEPGAATSEDRADALLGPEAAEHEAGLRGLALEASAPGVDDLAAGYDPVLARRQRWRALAALLRACCASRPVLLVVEDVHWADEGAQELLLLLAANLSRRPFGMLMTTRPGADLRKLPPGRAHLQLGPLDTDAAEALLSDLLGGRNVTAQAELLRRSQGNPLYLRELAHGLASVAGDLTAAAIPDTLRGLLVSRIDRLPAPARRLLQSGAVLGVRFPERLARGVYELEPATVTYERALEALLDGGFLEDQSNGERVLAFRHALMQEVAYGMLFVRVRRVLHETVARLGESVFAHRRDAEAAFFAHHFWAAGLRREAAPHLWKAGRQAASRHDLAASEGFLEKLAEALAEEPDLLSDPGERALFLEISGTVLLQRGRLGVAEDRFRRLELLGAELAGPEWQARALERRAVIAWGRGELEVASERAETGLNRIASTQHDGLAADLHNVLGVILYYRGDPDAALREHESARHLRERADDLLGLAKTHLNIGNVHFDLRDDLSRAEDHFRRALELARRAGDRLQTADVLNNLGRLAKERGDWDGALALLRDSSRIYEETGELHHAFVALRNRAECEIALGRLHDAFRHLAALLDTGDTYLEPVNRVIVRLLLFDACTRAFDDVRAAEILDQAKQLARALGTAEVLDELAIRSGRLHAARGEWATATEAFEGAAQAAASLHHSDIERLARAHLRRARAYGGRPEPPEPPADGGGRRPLLAVLRYLAADTRAVLDPTSGAAEALRESALAAADVGDVGLERAALLREAEVRRALGDATEGVARDRAADVTRRLLEGLPAELRDAFLAHPRNRDSGPAPVPTASSSD